MSIKHIPATLNKNQLFLVGIIIIYFISLAQFARCSNENNIRALTEEVKYFLMNLNKELRFYKQ